MLVLVKKIQLIGNLKRSLQNHFQEVGEKGRKKSFWWSERKGRKSYERENPGSDLKAPQPEGGQERDHSVNRMGGMKGPHEGREG